ncbi:ATP-dependent DNA helicase PIF1-like protein [Tanacetum coccineum]
MQFLVDGYTMVETEHLYFHRAKQSKLRCDTYSNIRQSVAKGNTDPMLLGKLFVLASSFTGGPRYMKQNYMDAMALCRWYGCPDLYKLVSDFMMHGPCGEDDPTHVCMVDEKCTKHFPEKFTERSSVDSEGYPVYRRRDNGRYVEKSKSHLHNGYVIP